MWRYWPRYVAACRRRYGSAFTLRVAQLGTIVYLSDPADIKKVFAGDAATYHAGEANSMLSGLLGPASVLVVDEDVHRDRRRLMLEPFTREAVARQTRIMADIAAADIAGWPVGKTFPVAPRMSKITLEVILRTVIGASDPARLAALRDVMPRLLNLSAFQLLAITSPGLQKRLPWRGVRRRIAQADHLLYAEIADRRADPELASRSDALAMLVRAADQDGRTMTDSELRDQLMTLLVAGHDTTATGLAWALERLTRHPAVLARAVEAAEASAAGDPEGDEYLDAVAKETLRSRPVVFDVGRILTRPVDIAGYHLPAGVMVAPGVGLVHSDDQIYPDPDRFDPDRMVGATLSPTTWLPFGGGARRCLGATFAMAEMRVVLREVLRRTELVPTGSRGERQRVKHVILTPDRGGLIEVARLREPRRAGSPETETALPRGGR
jgi:cytochrome P450 family 135